MIGDELIVADAATVPSRKYGMVCLNPDGSWIGGGSPISTPYSMQAYYEVDGTYDIEYYGEAMQGTLLSNPTWRVFRVRYTSTDKKFYDKTWAGTAFDKAVTDLATVSAYVYS